VSHHRATVLGQVLQRAAACVVVKTDTLGIWEAVAIVRNSNKVKHYRRCAAGLAVRFLESMAAFYLAVSPVENKQICKVVCEFVD
jgi:hypothetical protein